MMGLSASRRSSKPGNISEQPDSAKGKLFEDGMISVRASDFRGDDAMLTEVVDLFYIVSGLGGFRARCALIQSTWRSCR